MGGNGVQRRPAAPISPDLASDNSFLSPTTNIQDDHSLSFGLGDVTLGDKTSARGDGAVAVGGANHGDIRGTVIQTSGQATHHVVRQAIRASVDNSTHVTHTSTIDDSHMTP